MIATADCLSQKLGPLGSRVEIWVREYSRRWWETPSEPPIPEITYPSSEKKDLERELTDLINRLAAEQESLPVDDRIWDSERLDRWAVGLRPFFKRVLGRAAVPLESVYDERFVESTRQFIAAARDFDPEIGIDSVYQALRNVWIMNTLQYFLEIEVQHTDAIFGYSMVYPYLDNVLDDAGTARQDKLCLLLRLKNWLEGERELPRGPREDKLLALIRRIEGQFPRTQYPGVYQSMLTIYNAQVKSLLQQRETHPPYAADILGISMEKGGTSVLADGYLAGGTLTPSQEDFCFGFGTFLQLADDLQDIAEDVRRGHMTLFSQTAGRYPLDPLVYKLLRFMSQVVDQTLDAGNSRQLALQNVIRRACTLMYMESVGKHSAFFSRACARRFQKAFPVRFNYLKKMRQTLQDRFLTGHRKISDLDPVSTALLTFSSRALSLD